MATIRHLVVAFCIQKEVELSHLRAIPECSTCNNGLKIQDARFRLNVRKNPLTIGEVQQWNQLNDLSDLLWVVLNGLIL